MFSTGSKLFLGLTGAAVLAAVLYGLTQELGALGGIGLTFLAIARGITRCGHDLGSGQQRVRHGRRRRCHRRGGRPPPWRQPVAARRCPGMAMLAIGTVTDVRYFVAGLVRWC
ncbi:MAG: hypothetical protein R2705_23275 [Ilumatobacteraceae bacterium]